MTRVDRAALALYPSVALAVAFLDHRVRRFAPHVVDEHIPSVLAGTSGAPAKYRVLMPHVLDRLSTTLGTDPYLTFLVVEFVMILAVLVMTHRYLRHWYSPGASAAGTLALAAFLPLTFTNSWAHPDTFPDLLLVTAGALAIAARRDGLLALLLAIGMVNRETSGFLVVLWCLERWRERGPSVVLRGAGLVAIVTAVYVAVRWVRGFESYRMFMLFDNLQTFTPLPEGFDPYTRIAGYFWMALLAPAVWLAVRASRQQDAPSFFRNGLIVSGLHVAVIWLFAAVIETRVFVPVLPLLLSAALGAFVPPRRPPVVVRAALDNDRGDL